MNSKLIVTGAGLFGFGALVGWALTADYYENLIKKNAEIINDVITSQERELQELHNARVLDSMEPINWIDPSDEAVAAASETVLDLSQPIDGEVVGDILVVDGVPVGEILDSKDAVVETNPEISPEGIAGEPDEEAWEEIPTEPVEETRSRLQKIIDDYAMNPDDRDEFVSKAVKRLPYDGTPPFVISQQDFAADDIGESYDKITLTWYDRDRVLVDELEDPIPYQEYIGVQCLSEFGGAGDDPDTVFVRNHRLLTDFEVVRVEDELPIHIRYDIGKDEFQSRVAAGTIQLRDEDQ